MSYAAVNFVGGVMAVSILANVLLFAMWLYELGRSSDLKSARDAYSRSIGELHDVIHESKRRLERAIALAIAKDSHILQLNVQIQELLSEEEE